MKIRMSGHNYVLVPHSDCVEEVILRLQTCIQVAMEKLEAEVVRDNTSDNPMVTCAKDMVDLMIEVEVLLQ